MLLYVGILILVVLLHGYVIAVEIKRLREPSGRLSDGIGFAIRSSFAIRNFVLVICACIGSMYFLGWWLHGGSTSLRGCVCEE